MSSGKKTNEIAEKIDRCSFLMAEILGTEDFCKCV